MVIAVDAELQTALEAAARADGTTAEDLARAVLRQRFLHDPARAEAEDWERRFLAAPVAYGVSLPNEAFLGEALYDG